LSRGWVSGKSNNVSVSPFGHQHRFTRFDSNLMKQDLGAQLVEYRAHHIVISNAHTTHGDNHVTCRGLTLNLGAQDRAFISNDRSPMGFASDKFNKRCQRSTVALRKSARPDEISWWAEFVACAQNGYARSA